MANEELQLVLKRMIDVVHRVQKVTISNRNSLYSSEFNKLNCGISENKQPNEISRANQQLARKVGLKKDEEVADKSGITAADYNEMFEDLDATEVIEYSMIEFADDKEY